MGPHKSFCYIPNGWLSEERLTCWRTTQGEIETAALVANSGTAYSATVDEGTTVSCTISDGPEPVGGDTVTITKAEYKSDKSELKVEATSSDQPSVTLTLVGFGNMSWKNNKYEYKAKPVANPGSVTVTSSGGGSDTKTL